MIDSFYSAVSGLKGFQQQIDVTANNLANSNTVGYKAQQANFSDLVYTQTATADGSSASVSIGNGVRVSEVSSYLGQGNLEETGKTYDFAIMGPGYFAIKGQDEQVYYTRNGNFHVGEVDGQTCLLTADGYQVLDKQQSPVDIAELFSEDEADRSDSDNSQDSAGINLGVFVFTNPEGLIAQGSGLYLPSQSSGEETLAEDAYLVQGSLEGSNVDMVTELSDLMRAQRGFQFNAKLVQTADELENIANTLRQY